MRPRRVTGHVMRAAVLGTVVLAASCTPNDDIPGGRAAGVSNAEALREVVTSAGIGCADAVPFDPTENIASDGFDYEKPTGLICTADDSKLYLVAYASAADRDEALDHGEISLGLCNIRSGEAGKEGWYSAVGANWRIASPDAASAIQQIVAMTDGAGSDSFGCLFSE